MSVRSAAPRVRPPVLPSQRATACLLAALAIGAAVAADPAGLSPLGATKWMVISTLGFAAGGWAAWQRRTPGDLLTRRLWCALLGVLGVAALVGGDVPTALLGHPSRHLGLITWVLFALLFAAGQAIVAPPNQRTVVRGIALASVVTGLWSTWELAIGRVIDIDVTTSRLTGPFGSAAVLGAATCLLGPVAVGLALDHEELPWWRMTAAVGGGTTAVALVGSGTRGAWVAAAATLVLVAVRLRPGRRAVIASGLAMAAAIAVVAPRLDDVGERAAGGASRLDEWRVAVRVIARHPLLGVGPEGYRIAVAEGIDVEYERAFGRDRGLPDRAHSAPLDIALSGGVLAAVAWGALVLAVGHRCARLIRRGAPAMGVGLAAGVVAYGVQQLVLFPLAEVDPLWWACAGLVLAMTDAAPVATTTRSPGRAVHPDAVRRGVAVGAMALAPIALVAGSLDVAADRLAKRALDDLAAGRGPDAIDEAVRATELRPDDIRYRLIAAHVHAQLGTIADIDRGLAQIDSAAAWTANDPYARDQWAGLLLQRAQVTTEPADIAAALAAWQRLVEDDPHRARWQRQLGRAAVLAGDVELARRAWTAAVELAPDDPVARQLLDALPPPGSEPAGAP